MIADSKNTGDKMIGVCRICGIEKTGRSFATWVPDTFTNFNLLFPGDVICEDCIFWFDQRSEELQTRIGKDKPQKMQNYSHFIVDGAWIPVSKGDKSKMAMILLGDNMPEMAAIAESGQKHIAFRARRNPPGQNAGWVQFEEQAIWINQAEFRKLLMIIEDLYVEFSKGEIESGNYRHQRIIKFGISQWAALEEQILPIRSTGQFKLALFLAQKEGVENDGTNNGNQQRNDRNAPENYLAGNTDRLQEQVPDDNLDTVRERDPGSGLYIEHGEVRQQPLFKAAGGDRAKRG